jgi:hypothetical protein
MKACYLAALIAITMSIASHVFVLGTIGPIAPEFFTGVRLRVRACCRLSMRFFHSRIAAALARREHQIEIFARRNLAVRELTDATRNPSRTVR